MRLLEVHPEEGRLPNHVPLQEFLYLEYLLGKDGHDARFEGFVRNLHVCDVLLRHGSETRCLGG